MKPKLPKPPSPKLPRPSLPKKSSDAWLGLGFLLFIAGMFVAGIISALTSNGDIIGWYFLVWIFGIIGVLLGVLCWLFWTMWRDG